MQSICLTPTTFLDNYSSFTRVDPCLESRPSSASNDPAFCAQIASCAFQFVHFSFFSFHISSMSR